MGEMAAATRGDALSAKRRDDLADWAMKQGAKQPRLDGFFQQPNPVSALGNPFCARAYRRSLNQAPMLFR